SGRRRRAVLPLQWRTAGEDPAALVGGHEEAVSDPGAAGVRPGEDVHPVAVAGDLPGGGPEKVRRPAPGGHYPVRYPVLQQAHLPQSLRLAAVLLVVLPLPFFPLLFGTHVSLPWLGRPPDTRSHWHCDLCRGREKRGSDGGIVRGQVPVSVRPRAVGPPT